MIHEALYGLLSGIIAAALFWVYKTMFVHPRFESHAEKGTPEATIFAATDNVMHAKRA